MRHGWSERFGKTPPLDHAREVTRPRILLHAVSVGETHAIRELVPLLTQRAEVVVSATTDTGFARAKELYSSSSHVVRYPLDFSWAVRRFMDAVKPDVVALVELEVWPNFVRECGRRGIPIGVINGRLSERSYRGYRRIHRWVSPSFASLAFAAVQDEAYAERFRAIGARDVVVTGSMKWDAARIRDTVEGADQLAAELGIDRARPLVVGGSTAEGEEALLHEACPAGIQLLCAPRKPERFDEAAEALPGCIRRSDRKPGASAERYLLDTIGELGRAYALADVVVMGRSFGNLYGSDPIEPAALGKPVVAGPAMDDFVSIAEALASSGGLIRTTREALPRVLAELLGDAERRREVGARGRECVRRNQGASVRNAELVVAASDRLVRRDGGRL